MLVSFVSGLMLVLFTKTNAAEEQHGGEIPLPTCACCDPTNEAPVEQSVTAATNPIIPLSDIEIK